ncbi:MAG: hypothetical protein ACJ75J_03610 [Cytophagaceae bacterium]
MKTERYLVIGIFACIFLRYVFEYLSLPELAKTFIYLVFLLEIVLLSLFFLKTEKIVYRIVLIYYFIAVLGILLELAEWKRGYPLMFIGSLGNFLFPAYMVYTRRKKMEGKEVFRYLIALGLLLWIQNIFLFFIATQNYLVMGHMSSYFIAAACFYILFNARNSQSLSEDERKIIVFILITAVLSALGVTFKENFYVH